MLSELAGIIRKTDPDLQFTILEVGAVKLGGNEEPFYQLLDFFPGSDIAAFELEEEVCAEMNAAARPGVRYHPVALGARSETRTLHITNHPMCCSLYAPNEPLISLYNNFEVAYLKSKEAVETVSLDAFVAQSGTGAIDFIKIDVQGAELDIFKGGAGALKDVLAIVCEVEFIPHYVDQPLFGDVCAFLSQHDLMFHKFLNLGGRALKPTVLNNNPNHPSQHIWSDAVYIHHVQAMDSLSDRQLLKLSLLACVYKSPDVAVFCLARYDERNASTLAGDWMKARASS